MYTTLSVTSVSIRRQNISNRVIRSISHSNHKANSGPPCPGRRCWPQLRQQP